MGTVHPFRFATGGRASSGQQWVDLVRKVEDLGYSTLSHGQHITVNAQGPIAALSAAAAVTTSLRFLSIGFINDFYHPVTLAVEAGTLDRISDGRLDLGISAGWLRSDFELAGIPFDPPGVRVSRLQESVRLIKQLFQDGPVAFRGDYYRVNGLDLRPKSVQRPHPPIFIGGGGRRMLSFAAREANIIGLDLQSTADGKMDFGTMTAEAVAQRIDWIRQAAGDRFKDLELHIHLHSVVVTDDRRRGAELAAQHLASYPSFAVINTDLTTEQLLESPHILIGSVEHIVETLHARREQYGISYIGVGHNAVESFAPVVAKLAGK